MDLDNKTLTLFKSFVSDICKVFPEHKECIDKNYSETKIVKYDFVCYDLFEFSQLLVSL